MTTFIDGQIQPHPKYGIPVRDQAGVWHGWYYDGAIWWNPHQTLGIVNAHSGRLYGPPEGHELPSEGEYYHGLHDALDANWYVGDPMPGADAAVAGPPSLYERAKDWLMRYWGIKP